MYKHVILVATLVFLMGFAGARADWLDDAWSSKSTMLHGNPAITVHPDGVSVVLPKETLDEAFAQRGMTREDALRAFLGRYSPQCSHVLDLNTAQPNLTELGRLSGLKSRKWLMSLCRPLKVFTTGAAAGPRV